MRSSQSIQLLFLGSALAILGCGGNQQANAKKPCPPRPDGTPDPNCAANNNRSHVRTGGFIFFGGGGGSNTSSVKSGLAGGTTTSSGAKTGGFGRTGGSTSSVAS